MFVHQFVYLVLKIVKAHSRLVYGVTHAEPESEEEFIRFIEIFNTAFGTGFTVSASICLT